MLPEDEIDTLLHTFKDAVELALDGRKAQGRAMLQAGVERAENLLEAGEPWAAQLMSRWRHALDTFNERYGGERG